MKKNKAFFAGALVAALLVGGTLWSGNAQAASDAPRHQGRNDCIYQSLSAEKQAQFDVILKEFDAKTAPLRDKIAAKHIELKTLGNAPTPDAKAIGKASEELVALRNEFAKERQIMADRVNKELGIDILSGKGAAHGYNGSPCGSPEGPRGIHSGARGCN